MVTIDQKTLKTVTAGDSFLIYDVATSATGRFLVSDTSDYILNQLPTNTQNVKGSILTALTQLNTPKIVFSDGSILSTVTGGAGSGMTSAADLNFASTSGVINFTTNSIARLTISNAGVATFTGSIIGTLGTAAQPNITSIGTLSSLYLTEMAIIDVADGSTVGGRYGTGNIRLGYIGVTNRWRPTGYNNTAFGELSAKGYNTVSGSGNVAIGRASLYVLSSGADNTCVGQNTGYAVSTGINNTLIGSQAGSSNTNISTSICVGNLAGYYETASSKLFIDAFDRATEAAGRTGAIIYGVMNATPASQTLALNATVSVLGDLYSIDWTDYTATTTVTGFTGALSYNKYQYKLIGKELIIVFYFEGTSNAAGFTFTLPYTSKPLTGMMYNGICDYSTDAGSSDGKAFLTCTQNTNIVNILRSGAGAWTSSGVKSARGMIRIPIA